MPIYGEKTAVYSPCQTNIFSNNLLLWIWQFIIGDLFPYDVQRRKQCTKDFMVNDIGISSLWNKDFFSRLEFLDNALPSHKKFYSSHNSLLFSLKNDIIIIFSLKYLSNKKMHFSLTNIIFLPYFIKKFFFFTYFIMRYNLFLEENIFCYITKYFSKIAKGNLKTIIKKYFKI